MMQRHRIVARHERVYRIAGVTADRMLYTFDIASQSR
jgi:hypothetical protein